MYLNNLNKIKLNWLIIISLILSFSINSFSQIGGKAGAFSRLGFGARGIAMGNALASVTSGEISTYYNPSLIPFAEYKTINVTYSFLSLDRYLNFLSYGQAIKPSAGVALGLINAGVRNIEERDSDGNLLGNINTSENLLFLSFGNRIHKNVSLGITFKLFYHKLYTKISSTTVGFDFGILTNINENLAAALVIKDINSKYQWNTTEIYGKAGTTVSDHFPRLYILSFCYKLPRDLGLTSLEFEKSTANTNVLRIGTEITVHKNFALRAGLDRFIYSNNYSGLKPTFGYSLNFDLENILTSLDYAYVIESFSPGNIHIITLTINF